MLNPSLSDSRDSFYFNPLYKVIYGYDQELFLRCGDWEWSQDIHSSYYKWPWTSNRMLNVGSFLREPSELLTLGALLDELESVL